MNPRTTGILFLVALALGAFVYLYEIEGEKGRLEAESQGKRLFPGIEADAVEWLALTTSDGSPLRAERSADGWQLVEPLSFAGDSFALDGVAAALVGLESESAYDDPQEAAVYGLDDAGREVRFFADAAEHAVRLGAETPMGGNTYASVVGEPSVYTVKTYGATALRKTLDDFREKRVLRFDTAAVEHLTASWPGGRVELVREDGSWRMTAPVESGADGDTVDGLLSDLSYLRADGFVDAPPSDTEAGLETPAFVAELTLAAAEEGGEARRLSLAVGAEGEEGRLVRAAGPSLYRIASERIDDLPREVARYRDRQLSSYPAIEARRMELVFPDEGGVTVVATREDDGWTSDTLALAPEKLARLVDELSRLEASDILAERVGPDERAELGLDPPHATLLVYGEAEGDAAERLAEIRIGQLRAADGVVAQTGENPIVFQLPLELTEHIPISLEALRNHYLVVEEAEAPAPPASELDPAVSEPPVFD